MFKKTILSAFAMAALVAAQAQDSTKKATTTITGSVDAYYRYDFAGKGNNLTSFTNSINSFELGMASVKFDHSFGKVTATADLGFGRRADEFSYNDALGVPVGTGNGSSTLAAIKQAYLTYSPSSKVKFTLGKWATHVGWELVDAYANRNYSMSYGFSYGPFFHTGFKADISLGGKTALMVGVANPTDFTTTTSGGKMVIAQLSTATKNDKLKAYLNYQGGTNATNNKISQLDLVLNYAASSKFGIVYDGTIQNQDGGQWSSNALYFNYDPTSKFGLTLRGESFDDLKAVKGIASSITAVTLSANFKIDNLTIIPEFRLDNSNNNTFIKSDASGTKSASSFILAATYKF